MKGKANEWISIADLMAGVMAVIMLLLVISVVQRTSESASEQAEAKKVRQLLIDLQDSVHKEGEDELVTIDQKHNVILLRERFFDDGSACVAKSDRKNVLELIQKLVKAFLATEPDGDILVEGHTNSIPVKDIRQRTEGQWDFDREHCSLYDDNLTLSAARAREVRAKIVADASLDPGEAGRIIVAGYGDSRPLSETDPKDASNKRVEIRLRIHGKLEK